ncbi:MAG: GAF and ANTAR domain-containing protein [Candidatus Omnitrophica bacterium]|nr:GAF and ANTAR domain-containing protein [Candidatus Omnitrophota bacterium]MCM8793118.1 GAF and ANTAR domain-containing protein [Candidatus Omnitrophota bacterium]
MGKEKFSYTKQFEALAKISQAITSNLYLEDILKLIVTVTAQVMDSKICSLLLLDEEREELVIKATQSVSEAYNKKPNLKLGEGIAGRVAREGKPITVLDVRKDPRYINRRIAEKEGLCSLLSVPLKVKGKVIGVLNVYTSKPHRFRKEEINILMTVANQSAVVIENAHLLTESKIIREELEARKLIERAKGILMKEENLSEEDAFRKIQKYAMDNRRSMREVAEAIILTHEMKTK